MRRSYCLLLGWPSIFCIDNFKIELCKKNKKLKLCQRYNAKCEGKINIERPKNIRNKSACVYKLFILFIRVSLCVIKPNGNKSIFIIEYVIDSTVGSIIIFFVILLRLILKFVLFVLNNT